MTRLNRNELRQQGNQLIQHIPIVPIVDELFEKIFTFSLFLNLLVLYKFYSDCSYLGSSVQEVKTCFGEFSLL